MKFEIAKKEFQSKKLTIALHRRFMTIWEKLHKGDYDIFVDPYPEEILEEIVDFIVDYFGKEFTKDEAIKSLSVQEIVASVLIVQNEVIHDYNKMVEVNFIKGTDLVPEL